MIMLQFKQSSHTILLYGGNTHHIALLYRNFSLKLVISTWNAKIHNLQSIY